MLAHLRNLSRMELCFVCPVTGKDYASEGWWIMGELRVREDARGNRVLVGRVAVECPHCGNTHSYSVEELVCPWSQAGG